MEEISRKVTIKNSIWKLIESFGSRSISLIVSIVLARLLIPEDYGVIALTSVFISFTDILIQGGFSTALIRKENVNEDDYGTVLTTSIIIAAVLYGIIFFCAPFISKIYESQILCPVLRIVSLNLFCQAFSAVRTAVISREMKFKTLFACSISSTAVSGIIGIIFAYLNFGVWALVAQQLIQQFFLTLILYFKVKIKIKFIISKRSIMEMFPFSIKILLSSLLSFIGDSMYSLAIGKVYSVDDLAYYQKGSQIPCELSLHTFSAISSVFLPVFSSYKTNFEKLNDVFGRVVNVMCYIIFPMMAGLCLTADSFIEILLTSKWLGSVNILRWFCLYYTATPIMLINVQLHFAVGKSETRIKTEIIRIILMISSFIILMALHSQLTVTVAVVSIIQVIIAVLITVMTSHTIGFNINNIAKNILTTVVSVAIMCLGTYMVDCIRFTNVFTEFFVKVVCGILIYWVCSLCFKSKAYNEVIGIVKVIIKKEKK